MTYFQLFKIMQLLLTAQFDSLQAKMNQLVVQLEDEKLHRTNLQGLNDKLETKIGFFMSRSTKQEEEIRGLKNRNCADNIIQSKPQKNNIRFDLLWERGCKNTVRPLFR